MIIRDRKTEIKIVEMTVEDGNMEDNRYIGSRLMKKEKKGERGRTDDRGEKDRDKGGGNEGRRGK